MSYITGENSINPLTHFKAGMKDFIRLDKVRFINIIGSIQYGTLYSVIYLFIGLFLNTIFPPLIKGSALLNIFLWIVLQSIVIILITFYTQKFVEAIPGIPSFFPKYFNIDDLLAKGLKPYGIEEYKGDMASSIVLIGTQVNLFQKIIYFTTEFAKQYI